MTGALASLGMATLAAGGAELGGLSQGPTLGLTLALLSSLAWLGLDLARKALGEGEDALEALLLLVFAQSLVTGALVTGVLALGPEIDASGDGAASLWSVVPPGRDGWVALGLVTALNLLSNWLFLRALQASPLSLTTPYLALTPVFTALIAIPVDGEWPGPRPALGILLVTLGAFVLPRSESARSPLEILRALRTESGSLMMIGVAVIWSLTPTIDRAAARSGSVLGHALAVSLALLLVLLLIALGRGRRLSGLAELARRRRREAAACGLLVTAGFVLQLAAWQSVPIAFVETLKRGIGVFGALLVGRWFYSEDVGAARLVAGAMMVVGVALVVI